MVPNKCECTHLVQYNTFEIFCKKHNIDNIDISDIFVNFVFQSWRDH